MHNTHIKFKYMKFQIPGFVLTIRKFAPTKLSHYKVCAEKICASQKNDLAGVSSLSNVEYDTVSIYLCLCFYRRIPSKHPPMVFSFHFFAALSQYQSWSSSSGHSLSHLQSISKCLAVVCLFVAVYRNHHELVVHSV